LAVVKYAAATEAGSGAWYRGADVADTSDAVTTPGMFAVPRALLLRVPVFWVPVLRRLTLWFFTVALLGTVRLAAGVLCRLTGFGAVFAAAGFTVAGFGAVVFGAVVFGAVVFGGVAVLGAVDGLAAGVRTVAVCCVADFLLTARWEVA
jgi:hypothetical protein